MRRGVRTARSCVTPTGSCVTPTCGMVPGPCGARTLWTLRCQDPVVWYQDPVGPDPVDPVGQNPVVRNQDPVVWCQDPVVRYQDPVVPGPCEAFAIPSGFLVPGPEVVSTPLSAKTAAKWLKEGGTGVVALVSYENLQDPPGVPPDQAAQLKSLLMEFSDVFEPITGQQKRRLQEGEDVGAGTPLSSGSGGSEQQPAAGSDPDHDADSDDALKPSEPKRLRREAEVRARNSPRPKPEAAERSDAADG
ncbi:hypothetical protein QJQ45_013206 [Haematococcus lacustris]|nr:hypothetical protein QJQ45_013206 [Haematococcus lacustris]